MRPQVNLLPKYERYSNLTYYIFIFGIILFLLLAGILTYLFITERSVLEEEETQISFLTEQKTILESRLATTTEQDTSTLSEAVAFAESHAVPVSPLVDEFVQLLPENSYLVRYQYNYHTVSIDTHFETMMDTANYMKDLTDSRYLVVAKVDYINTTDPDIETTTEADETEEDMMVDYEIVPRYQATYSMDVNQQALMEEKEDE